MIVRRLAQRLRGQDWFAVVVELLVVMIGIVAAFQVDRWWEARRDRLGEAGDVQRLIADLDEDVPALDDAVSLAEVCRDFVDQLAAVAADPSLALDRPAHFLAAVSQAAYTYTPSLASSTFDDLRSTGNLKLIGDPDIRRGLRAYYDYDQGQRQFMDLNLMSEFRFFELAAGIATLDQHRFVQDGWFVVNEANLDELQDAHPDEAGVREAAARLRAATELQDRLPKVRGLQIDQIQAHTRRLEIARSLLERLHEYADRFSSWTGARRNGAAGTRRSPPRRSAPGDSRDPMALTIRACTPDDWPALCRVHDRARPDELRGSFDPRAFVALAEDPEAEDTHDCELFVAEEGGEVLGFVGIDPPYLAWLYVDPAHYRRGIGRALLRHALARLGEDAWTICCGNNTAALALYAAEGFAVVERFTGTNAGYEGPAARLALSPELRGWEQPRRSAGGSTPGVA